MSKRNRRKFKGFAALDRCGNLVWGTLRTTEEAAKEAFDRWNPDPTGEGMGEVITDVTIYLNAEK